MKKNKFKQSGVYAIKNLKTGKIYVGSCQDFHKRRLEHFNDLKNNKHHCEHLQRSYNMYNKKYFIFCIIEYVPEIANLLTKEQYWFSYYGVGDHNKCYNTSIFAGAPTRGLKFSEKTKHHLSKIHKGRKFTEEHKKNLGLSNKGKKRTPEQRRRIREGVIKHGFTEKQRQALKRRNDTYKNGNNPNAKKIICLETSVIFDTIKEALAYSGGKDAPSLSRQCKAKKPYRGKHYLFYNDYIQLQEREIQEILNTKKNIFNTSKKVYCAELNKYFKSTVEAGNYFKVHPSTIQKICKSKNNYCSYLDLHFIYVL